MDIFCCIIWILLCIVGIAGSILPWLPWPQLSYACYYNMFDGCTSLTTAPDLPATQLVEYCYYQMFYDCTNLTSIKIGYVGSPYDAPTNAFMDWVYNVSLAGTFYYNGNSTAAQFGFKGNWIIQHY